MRVEIVELPIPCVPVEIDGEVVLLVDERVPHDVRACLARSLAPIEGCTLPGQRQQAA